ncbi:MAG: hypothetical protein ABI867_17320 [Kofleriaceae bacterium]
MVAFDAAEVPRRGQSSASAKLIGHPYALLMQVHDRLDQIAMCDASARFPKQGDEVRRLDVLVGRKPEELVPSLAIQRDRGVTVAAGEWHCQRATSGQIAVLMDF